jgi:hypothetical protein
MVSDVNNRTTPAQMRAIEVQHFYGAWDEYSKGWINTDIIIPATRPQIL